MNEQDIVLQLNTIVRNIFDDDSIVLTADTTAEDIDGWDSMKHINIVVAAEGHFGVRFLTSEIELLRNVGDFVTLISRKIK